MDQHSFLFQAMIYLGAAVLLVPLARKMGLGSVLGYLIAGILIGPSALNLVGDRSEDVMHVAEFGVVMMLFVIGLELEPSLLWKLRKPIVGMGGLQVLITAAIITGICFVAGIDRNQAIAIGLIAAPSSTALVIQTLQEKGLMKTDAGQSSFAVLLFQDIAVIPMLAVLPMLAPSQSDNSANHGSDAWISSQPGWVQTLAVIFAVGIIVLAGRFLVRPLLRMVAATRSREVFTATTLLLVIAITLLMTSVGLSPALGTFLAGVVLANSEYRHELESDIEPFKGILLGIFFISVGAAINFSLMADSPLLVVGILLGLMAVKAVVLAMTGRVFNLSTDQNLIYSLGLCQVGEFAFVLLSFTRQANILNQHTADLLLAVVALSMALTPLLFLLNEKFLLPRFDVKEKPVEKEADTIEEKNPVIIAGFGHYGNTVGRFLRAHGIGTTILDIDSDRVDYLRKMGFRVYYGDASRYDLLHAAGASEARIILLTIDDPVKRLEMIETIKKHFPNLQIMVRSQNRYDAYDQMNAGMMHIYRETVDSALRMGVDTMKILGFRAYSASRAASTFLQYDERNLKYLSSIRDEKQYINTAREFIEELDKIIQNDLRAPELNRDKGWDEESLINDARNMSPSNG
ncbi:monovalent cation:proton antiporter-2 (CPA2) family protein [Flavihumibacter rivuli]|uniref:monovalent cation:proton antiporter-2 (CPA2) family protein n=1 Tax=Flavihumibacter rivuli TaxID=2838156 RepID=UPI001BDDCD31|nr:monovalent cation:proton antiporter-2 (CPA2) family protein [Flavihumibacter rivuli]ULQ57541.1 monovalent cation:proton antiporter-2 (CPA2) family protein [Flavihumibacter rivuli]